MTCLSKSQKVGKGDETQNKRKDKEKTLLPPHTIFVGQIRGFACELHLESLNVYLGDATVDYHPNLTIILIKLVHVS